LKQGATIALLAVALAAGAWAEHATGLLGRLTGASVEAMTMEGAGAGYTCPMHPEIVRSGPSSCPICGMDLVEASRGAAVETAGSEFPTVYIGPEVVHNLGVRTITVEKRILERRIDTVGYVEYDRTKLSDIYGPAEGYINGLTLRSEGERVRKGQFLFQLDSPTLSTYYDKTYAAQDGIVASLNIIEGEFVRPTTKLLTLADLSSVWVLADVFEAQAHWVKLGQAASVTLPYVAGRAWEGRIEYLYPNLDPETRTLRVRILLDNPDETLKPNMHAEVTIHSGSELDVLAIPREALIETGKSQRVVVATGHGHYQPREVTVGMEQGDWVEVASGLDQGAEVVTSGQFLLDSESSLEASLRRLDPETVP